MQAKFNELTGVLAAAQRSASKLEAGTKCESARSRNSLSQASKLITELRKMCLDASKSMPVKTKTKKEEPIVQDDQLPDPPVLTRQAAMSVEEANTAPLIADSIEKKVVKPRASRAKKA